MRALCITVCMVLLYACAPTPTVTLDSNEFQKTVQLNGVWQFSEELVTLTDVLTRTWQLQTSVDKTTHQFHHRLYVRFKYYSDLKYFSSASDDSANQLHVYTIYRSGGHCGIDTCQRQENIGIDLTDADLRSHIGSGYKILVSSKAGKNYIFLITPQMIRMQLEALSKYLNKN